MPQFALLSAQKNHRVSNGTEDTTRPMRGTWEGNTAVLGSVSSNLTPAHNPSQTLVNMLENKEARKVEQRNKT